MHKKAACKKIDMTIITASIVENFVPKGRVTTPNRMSFWKIFQTAFDPRPHFWKIMLQFVSNFMLKKPCLKVQSPQQ